MIDSFEAYKLYLALKLHFTEDGYDITESRKVNASKSSFQGKGIERAIQRVVRKYPKIQFLEYIVANIVAGDKYGGLFSTEGDTTYLAWQKRIESLAYMYEQELLSLSEFVAPIASPLHRNIVELFNCNGGYPPILRAYFGKTASLETLTILDKVTRFRDRLDDSLMGDVVWEQTSMLIYKYSPFVSINIPKYTNITYRIFEQESTS